MLKNTICSLIILVLYSFKPDINGPWIQTKGRQVIIYSRPYNHSKTDSPDSLIIQKIIKEQEQAILLINERLMTNFEAKVKIYLYNSDEAKEKIGTNSGGGCDFRKNRIYFTFHNSTICNTIRNTYDYVGVHEMVHIISNNELGICKTRFFGEGYSNALDGNYGVIMKDNQLAFRRNDSTLVKIIEKGKLLKPSDLLNNEDKIPEYEYYPQIGCLMDWLFKTYGVEKINKLYSFKKDKIVSRFSEVTGDSFNEMERRYEGLIQDQK